MIGISGINIQLGTFHLRNINLTIERNEFFILMGPTGAGKTVLLEAIAGLIPVRQGSLTIAGNDVTGRPPDKRGVGIVYQDYALFPHLTVRENITYGLHFHKLDRAKAKKRFERLVEELSLSPLLARYPTNLSGGESQRVSLARALMVEPSVLLLDEPLSALDPGFREEIRKGLKKLHRDSDVTFLMVTHDFSEALSLGSRGAVMNNGMLEQVGNMKEIFQHPNSAFVADFVGMKNLFPVQIEDRRASFNGIGIELETAPRKDEGFIAIRPEDIILSRKKLESSMRNTFRGIVRNCNDQGLYYEVEIDTGTVRFKSLVTKRSLIEMEIHEGQEMFLSFKSSSIHFF